MRTPLLLTAAALALAVAGMAATARPAEAQNARWCARTMSGQDALDCSFYTRQQCKEFISGQGGQCDLNPRAARAYYAPAPYRHRHHYR